MRTDDGFGEVGFVLEQNDVALLTARENLFQIAVRQLAVRAAPDENAVFALGIDLDDRVTGGRVGFEKVADVNAGLFEQVDEKTAVRADRTGVNDVRACTRRRERLIETLAARENRAALRGDGFAGADKLLDGVNVINVQ